MLDRLYTKLVAKMLFPLHELLKKHDTVRIFKRLEKSQWQSKEQILITQQQRLSDFIYQAYNDVPYYRQLIRQLGFTPDDVKSVDDLAKLPFLDKKEIKDNFEELKSKNAGVLKKFNTGGSSGTPLIFLLGNERVSHDVAEKWRATKWWDVDIGDKEIVAWGSPIAVSYTHLTLPTIYSV